MKKWKKQHQITCKTSKYQNKWKWSNFTTSLKIVFIQGYLIQWALKNKHFKIKIPMIFTNIATITLKNLYLTIPFKWIINIITIQLDNNSSFPYSKAIISSKCLKLIMMDSIKNLVLAILTICTKLQIIILYKAMKKIIFKSHNIYQ